MNRTSWELIENTAKYGDSNLNIRSREVELCRAVMELKSKTKEILRRINDMHADGITNEENWKEINEMIDDL